MNTEFLKKYLIKIYSLMNELTFKTHRDQKHHSIYNSSIIIILLCFVSANSIYSQSNWFWQQPLPTGNFLWAVDFININTGYAVGTVGTVMKTTNGGLNWELKNTPNTLLYGTSFVDENLGFAVSGDNGSIYRTANGGNNWTIVFTGIGNTLWDINFPNRTTGYAVGLNGLILKSTDSGINWNQQTSGTVAHLFSLEFIDSLNGVAGGNRILLKTSNGGINWISQAISFVDPFSQVTSVNYVDLNVIYGLVSSDDKIYKTTDGGLNWFSYQLPIASNDIERTISFVNKDTGLMVTDFGRIERTFNGGMNWTIDSTFKPSTPQIGVLRFVDYAGGNIAYVCGSGGRVIKTTNNGITWTTTTGGRANLESNYFTNEMTGYSVGWEGTILKTTNAGETWVSKQSNTTRILNDVHFANLNTGYVCGDSGNVLKTTNAGENWVALNSGVINNLNGIYFLDESIGVSVGSLGKIIRTTDGGNLWFVIESGTTFNAEDIFFINSTTGYISANMFLKTTNGGVNWINLPASSGKKIFFLNENTGYTIGGSGIIGKTINGGMSLIIQNGNVIDNLNSLYFINENNGFAIGEGGAITKTTNGGTNWIPQQRITNNRLFSIDFVNNNTGYIVGEFGTIIKTTNGGLVFINSNSEVIPNEYSLEQNYPNPFNSTTIIKYKITKYSEIKISLYDISGKELINLVNEYQTTGNYEILFDASEFSTGVYFYSLFINNRLIKTKKLILTK
ncbi:MAG: YCF48-related protein [Ignavibacteria bacterium]